MSAGNMLIEIVATSLVDAMLTCAQGYAVHDAEESEPAYSFRSGVCTVTVVVP